MTIVFRGPQRSGPTFLGGDRIATKAWPQGEACERTEAVRGWRWARPKDSPAFQLLEERGIAMLRLRERDDTLPACGSVNAPEGRSRSRSRSTSVSSLSSPKAFGRIGHGVRMRVKSARGPRAAQPSRKFMKSFLFWTGEDFGRPKSLRAPLFTLTSKKQGPSVALSSITAAGSSRGSDTDLTHL